MTTICGANCFARLSNACQKICGASGNRAERKHLGDRSVGAHLKSVSRTPCVKPNTAGLNKPVAAFLSASLLWISGLASAEASAATGVRITHIIPNRAGIVAVYLDTARVGLPACAGTTSVTFEFDATTPAGQAMLSGLLVAFSGNFPIDAVGTGTCDVGGGTVESLAYFAVRR